MKRYGNLWPRIIEFENILNATRKAQKGKRFRANVSTFNFNLETEILRLQEELVGQTYMPGGYRTFEIQEPKTRLISVAPYRDRVVHHALCHVIAPLLAETLIADTYANRVGFGTHRALKRFTHFSRSHRYVLQCDIRKYFPSIDHDILKQLIRRKIKCPSTLWLIDRLIDNSNPQEPISFYFPGDNLLTPLERRHGLPIGNLTSQLFANFYLSGFDHFVKETLGVCGYLRYVDDFAFFSNDRAFLQALRPQVEAYLSTLRLQIHPIKSQLFETTGGANFVGFRIFPSHIRVRSVNLRAGRRRLRYRLKRSRLNPLELEAGLRSLQSWFAHLAYADSWQLRHKILNFLQKRGILLEVSDKLKLG